MKDEWKKFWMSICVSLGLVGLIGLLGGRLEDVNLLPDQGASWYYWKLPEKQFWPRLTAWSFYIMHQVVVWLLIYAAQFKKREKRGYYGNCLLIANLFFVILHMIQTHIWYDGLAQDVPGWSSQGSVIVMLVLIFIMDNQRRGLFFKKPIKALPLLGDIKATTRLIRKYHGYFIAWAIVYTFWYHPTVATTGHLIGFFYMFLLFIQMSMIYTPVHMNKYWMFALEIIVLLHGTLVAIAQQGNMWPMFLFGFASLAVITQVYGLGLPKWMIRMIQIIYIVGVIIIYGGFTGHKTIDQIHQVLWIPIVEYTLVFVFLYIIGGMRKIKKFISVGSMTK